jgi:hypothetical protein
MLHLKCCTYTGSNRIIVTYLGAHISCCSMPRQGEQGASGGNLQSHISLGNVGAKVERTALLLRKVLLSSVKSLEQRNHVVLVCRAGRGKTRLVHAVVDAVVRPCVSLLNLGAKLLGVQLDSLVLVLDEVVKLSTLVSVPWYKMLKGKAYLCAKHAQNLTALVAHNALRLLVVQHRHRVASVKVLL